MTWGNALSLSAEFCFLVFGIIGGYWTGVMTVRGIGLLWRRWRVHHETIVEDKRSLEAIARYRRDLKL